MRGAPEDVFDTFPNRAKQDQTRSNRANGAKQGQPVRNRAKLFEIGPTGAK